MEKIYPVYTTIEKEPKTICRKIDDAVFEYPFFNEGVSLVKNNSSENYILQSGSIPEKEAGLELKGLIFHTSHCGSTLLCRMLNQVQSLTTLSETEAINGLLLSKVLNDISDDEVISQLKKIVNLYQQKIDSKSQLIIKLTSWNVYFISLFQQAFPNIKWIYIDRETESLTKSLLTKDGGFIEWWYYPVDHLRKQFLAPEMELRTKEEYLRAMISGHRLHANNNKDSNSLFVEYPQFMEEYEEILNHFNLNVTTTEIENSQLMRKYDSKSMAAKAWENNH